ncbi:MAG TPA: hypothetical protein VET83_09320 [Candidatus Dormibacteraeota bacterium]|nr:hypothetical protein [Candidatus Dormibacteraeota bacterium]
MKFGSGIHPRQWHRGAWLLALILAALVLLLTHRPTGGLAYAMDPVAAPPEGNTAGGDATVSTPAPRADSNDGYVSEIVDTSYTVGPASFFALDLPTTKSGARAVHLFGTVRTQGRKDIVVRLFRASDYDNWLKQKSGKKPEALWTSPRSGNLTLDQDLPAGTPIVLLFDNGYSLRTPKKVVCQLQLRYERNGTETFDTEGSKKVAGTTGDKTPAPEDNLPPPRSNTDDEMPPPPPPPPSGY